MILFLCCNCVCDDSLQEWKRTTFSHSHGKGTLVRIAGYSYTIDVDCCVNKYYSVIVCYMPFAFLAHIDILIWLSNLLTLKLPDEGYFRNESCALN